MFFISISAVNADLACSGEMEPRTYFRETLGIPFERLSRSLQNQATIEYNNLTPKPLSNVQYVLRVHPNTPNEDIVFVHTTGCLLATYKGTLDSLIKD